MFHHHFCIVLAVVTSLCLVVGGSAPRDSNRMVNQPSILDGLMHSPNQSPVSGSQFAPLRKEELVVARDQGIFRMGRFVACFFWPITQEECASELRMYMLKSRQQMPPRWVVCQCRYVFLLMIFLCMGSNYRYFKILAHPEQDKTLCGSRSLSPWCISSPCCGMGRPRMLLNVGSQGINVFITLAISRSLCDLIATRGGDTWTSSAQSCFPGWNQLAKHQWTIILWLL